jgi:hypothetical protein
MKRTTPTTAELWSKMAIAWARLAEQAERNSCTDLSYETPAPVTVPQPIQQQQQRNKSDE